ncbi:hypothetical protein Adt_32805 [Abeliophyllum distichum]|uniref:Uncharacterized protein n=1 Tax=Abeliophyllum distichum TaxID=126358 RepID=A0ABD1QUE9_9LAMI
MFAEFLNQFGKETGGSSYNVLDRQIVLYTGNTFLERKVPFEDVIGSRTKDVQVGKEVGGKEPKKYLFEGTFVSKRMFDVLNFCPSFDLEIDDEPNANDIELDDMEFIELDLKMIDEWVQMRYLSTYKNEEDVDANDDYILVDDSTPDIPRKRLRKISSV